MASLYKQRYTKKIPDDGEIVTVNGQQKVRVVAKDGRAKLYDCVTGRDGQPRLAGYSTMWSISYKDPYGVRRTRATGCRDKAAARAVLAKIEHQLEQVKSGIIGKHELALAKHGEAPISVHFDDYMQHLEVKTIRGRSLCKDHKQGIKHRLGQIIEDCNIEMLEDITAETLEQWMMDAKESGKSPRTVNTYRSAIVTFCNWAVKYKRLTSNPLASLFKADESADIRHARRALTKDEVSRLLKVTELRPVAEYGRAVVKLPRKKGKRAVWTREPLTWDNIEAAYQRGIEALSKERGKHALERYINFGRQRKLQYRLLLTTGLRRNELKAVTPDRLVLSGANPRLSLPCTATKNGKAATIPLRPEIAAELKRWIDEMELFPTDNVFDPILEIKVFNLDIAVAGIPKRDERNRVVDIHCMRHTFGTHLAIAGVPPRTAMAAMRHSKIDLTMNIYTDPALLDVAGAVNSLPSF
jgi:integrase